MKNLTSVPPSNLVFQKNTNGKIKRKLRVVTLNYLPSAYIFLSDWIRENGHEHVLAVTSPGIKTRATPSYKDVLKLIPGAVNTIVTSKMKSVLTPILPEFKPDLILCFTFAHRLSSNLCAIPTYGTINIHPSILPLYRGPNPMRQFYDGAKYFGSTAHRINEDYDAGNVLCQEYEKMPEIINHSTSVQWGKLIRKSIAKGVENAILGKAEIPQDASQATYAAPYKEAERWIDFKEPSKVVLRKTMALNLSGGLAKAAINGEVYKVHSANIIPNFNKKPAGSVIRRGVGAFEIATSDGAVKLLTEPFDPNKKYAHSLPYTAFVEPPKSMYKAQACI